MTKAKKTYILDDCPENPATLSDFFYLRQQRVKEKAKSTGIQNSFGPNHQTDWSLEKSTCWDILQNDYFLRRKARQRRRWRPKQTSGRPSEASRNVSTSECYSLFRVCRAALWMLWRSPGGAEGTHSVSDIVRDYNNDLQFLFWRAAWSSLVDWNGGPTPH